MAYKVKSDTAQAALRRVDLQRSNHDVSALEEIESLNLRARALEEEARLFPKGSSQRRAIGQDIVAISKRICQIKADNGIMSSANGTQISEHFVDVCEATLPREQFEGLMDQAKEAYGKEKRERREEWERKLGKR